jgi:hypothetical protein
MAADGSVEESAEPDELDLKFKDSIHSREAWLSVMSDPSALAYYANEYGESEVMLKARLFQYIGNAQTMPYPPRDS